MSAMLKVSDYIFQHLAQQSGVKHVFMLPGGACMHLVDSLGRNPDLRTICMLHEQGAAIAAEAYAQHTQGLGICLVTAGPGSTNAITGVAGAWIDSTPLLVLSGQAKREDLKLGRGVRQMGVQEVDIVAMVSPICKYATCVLRVEDVRYELEKAIYLALSGRRGPVWIDLPLDVQAAMIDPQQLRGYLPDRSADRSAEIRRMATAVLDSLCKAQRPVWYVGNGVRSAGAIDRFMVLAERLQIPILTSWKAADFLPEEHPLFIGRPGIIAQRGANFAQQSADCLIALGTRLDLCQTGFSHATFAPMACKFSIDADPAEIAKLAMPLAGSCVCSADEFIEVLLELSVGWRHNYCRWLTCCKDWQRRYPVILPEYCEEGSGPVNLYHLVHELSTLLQDGDVLVPGSSGACAEVTMQAIKVCSQVRIQNTPGLGSMGFGLPASLGACLASDGHRTICLVGDGGLQHNIQELQTLKNLQLPVKVLVLNNGGYGSIVAMQRARFNGHLVASNADSGLVLPDLQRLAYGYALPFARISNSIGLHEALRQILAQPGPLLCEVITDPSVSSAPRLITDTLPDGRMISRPMQELAPALPEGVLTEELRRAYA